MIPNFPNKIAIQVQNYFTREEYVLRRIDEVEVTQTLIRNLTSICNEPKIYQCLFTEVCGGLPYSEEKAKGFFEMGRKGWKENKHFIFLLMTQNGDIAACIDIKSPYLKNAEIGYWASRSHRGCMTNTSIALLKLANVAGYTGLFGRAKKENTASAKLLLRTGFKYDMKESENCKTYNYYNVCF